VVAKIKADEISSIIKERIDNFELSVDINETGRLFLMLMVLRKFTDLAMLWLEKWLNSKMEQRVLL
jgi:hypothetical protein